MKNIKEIKSINDLKFIKTEKILNVIKFQINEFDKYLEINKEITFERLVKIINTISVCSYINQEISFYLKHQRLLLDSFDNYKNPVIYYLKKNNLQMIKFLDEDIKKERNIFK